MSRKKLATADDQPVKPEATGRDTKPEKKPWWKAK